ncbi:MAG: bifunctional helix-turn-helix transcriptional regulator/GNAT family N-acetyltransferase [Desulfobacterales bacterium]|nr:bifunctional helix-turn-helix transcriptional regulator/GNAT family N-acetyltransferase [Desulfobacterales bacterium]
MFFLKDPPTPEEFQALSKRYKTLDPLSMVTMVKFLRTSSDLLVGFEKLLSRYGLSQGRFLILVVLNRAPDQPATPSELAGKIGVTKATMTGLVRGLERDGLISRRAGTTDKRQRMIRLTPLGLERLEKILPDYYDRAAHAMAVLNPLEKQFFIDLLAKVHDGIPELNAIPIRVAPFSPTYQNGVVDLILSIQQQEFQVDVTLEEQPDLLDIPGFYQQGAGNFWVALEGETVVGTLSLLDMGGGQVALRKMFVAPEHRGKGPAEALLDISLNWAREQGVAQVFLGTTDRFHRAHAFYEKNGFDRVAVEDLPTTFPRMDVDSIFYCRATGI